MVTRAKPVSQISMSGEYCSRVANASILERTEGLARLAVRLGANVAAGQDVVVLACDVEYASVARAVADAAYEAGARSPDSSTTSIRPGPDETTCR